MMEDEDIKEYHKIVDELQKTYRPLPGGSAQPRRLWEQSLNLKYRQEGHESDIHAKNIFQKAAANK